MVGAHIELARAEFGEVAGAVKRAAVHVGTAVAAAFIAGLLVLVGLPLFLGEALFGSMGWGILLGVLFLTAVALAAGVLAMRPAVGGSVGRPFLIALVIGVAVAVVLGLDLTNRGWTSMADAVLPGADLSWRPLALAVASLAIVGATLGLIGGALSGAGGGTAIAGFVGGAVAGALIGFLTAFAAGPRVGAALGVAAGLIAWIGLMGASAARAGFDGEALKNRFIPSRTIATAKETIEWARNRVPGSTRRTPGS
ncbi:MAG TPA: hypothetical protein VM427_09575 [Patescibacteria group bacterium]|nr:hypothetical protein [Patescibacteria group bacterium]